MGRVTGFSYDHANRKTVTVQPDPDGGGPAASPLTSYAYDAAGNQVSVTDPLQQTTQYAYDALNRKISETDPAPTGGAASPLTTW